MGGFLIGANYPHLSLKCEKPKLSVLFHFFKEMNSSLKMFFTVAL